MGGRISPARRLGGISFILSGTLYLIKSILDLVVGDPPSTGPEILEWRSSHELALAWTSEVLFAAAVLLVPAVIALYRSLGATDRPWVGFGCGVFATIIPTLFAVLMVHGRLAFPVYGITLDDQPLPWWCRSTTGVCTRSASFSPALRSCWVSP